MSIKKTSNHENSFRTNCNILGIRKPEQDKFLKRNRIANMTMSKAINKIMKEN